MRQPAMYRSRTAAYYECPQTVSGAHNLVHGSRPLSTTRAPVRIHVHECTCSSYAMAPPDHRPPPPPMVQSVKGPSRISKVPSCRRTTPLAKSKKYTSACKRPKETFRNVFSTGKPHCRSTVPLQRRYNRVQVVEWLLRQPGGMPSLAAERAHNGSLALHYAAANGCLECVRALVQNCPELSPNCQMENDVTPVYLAAQENHLEVLKYLVEKSGGNLNIRAKDGMAPVHAAAQMNALDCLKWMVTERKVDLNTTDDDGATAVHFAASSGHVKTLSWLLKNGAKVMADKHGRTPLHDAEENGHHECVTLLMRHDMEAGHPNKSRASVASFDKNGFANHTTQPKSILRKSGTTPTRRPPFYLHPPPGPGSGVTSHPENDCRNSSEPFYLHDPSRQPDDPMREIFQPRRVSDASSSASNSQAKNLDDDDNNNRRRSPYEMSVDSMNGSNGFKVEDLAPVHRRCSSVPSTTSHDAQPKAITVIADVHSSGESVMSISDTSEPHEYEEPFGLQELKGHQTQLQDSPKSSVKSSRRVSFTEAIPESLDEEPPAEEAPPLPQDQNLVDEEVEVTSPPLLVSTVTKGIADGAPAETFAAVVDNNFPLAASKKKLSVQSAKSFPTNHQSNPDAKIISRQISLPASQVAAPPPPPPPPLPPLATTSTSNTLSLKCSTVGAKMVRGESPTASTSDDSDRVSSEEDISEEILPRIPPKHPLAKAFVPPQFPLPSDGDTLIKPSVYLRTVAAINKTAPAKVLVARSREDLSDTLDDDRASSVASSDSGISSTTSTTVVPPPPPPPPPESVDQEEKSPGSQHPPLTGSLSQPFLGISAIDLQSVQLKTPVKPALRAAYSTENLKERKTDLIEELKKTRDIKGIRMMKEERAKQEMEKEKMRRHELTKQFSVDTFMDKMPEVDNTGAPIPPWKRQMLAKKAAEKAKKEAEEQRLREEQEKKKSTIPVWKRQLMQKKDPEPMMILPERISSFKAEETDVDENLPPTVVQEEMVIEEQPPLNPWLAQLRKTNSKLLGNE